MRFMTHARLKYLLENKTVNKDGTGGRRYRQDSGDPNRWDSRFFSWHLDRKGEGNNPHEPTHTDNRLVNDGLKYRERAKNDRQQAETQYKQDIASLDARRDRGELSRREHKIAKYDRELAFKNSGMAPRPKSEHNQKHRWLYEERTYKVLLTKDHIKTTKLFHQVLQQTRLVKSYNSNHQHNPMGEKGGPQGKPGGVACSEAYLEGLFDGPEGLLDMEHFFVLPQVEGGEVPFSNQQLKQILRELAIGVYTHSTVPFFSLHFNQDSDLFPVIHPVYENTLVGRVIGMLDYMMKGYLNGGVFEEEFIDGWREQADWKAKEGSALERLIDFQVYSAKHLKGNDRSYRSLRSLQEVLRRPEWLESLDPVLKRAVKALNALGADLPIESSTLSDFSGFRNSFRIIAKQERVEKAGSALLIGTDFDVEYTIEPSPEYEEAYEEYLRKTGSPPPGYSRLIASCDLMKERIRNHMVKMPMCREYFSMLGVINFFASYFSTLKKHRKIPVLPAVELGEVKGSPTLFPHLPIGTKTAEMPRINRAKAWQSFVKGTSRGDLIAGLMALAVEAAEADDDAFNPKDWKPPERKKLVAECAREFRASTMQLATPPFRRMLANSPIEDAFPSGSTQALEHAASKIWHSIRLLKGILGSRQGIRGFVDERIELIGAQWPNKTQSLYSADDRREHDVPDLKINPSAAWDTASNKAGDRLSVYLVTVARWAMGDSAKKFDPGGWRSDDKDAFINRYAEAMTDSVISLTSSSVRRGIARYKLLDSLKKTAKMRVIAIAEQVWVSIRMLKERLHTAKGREELVIGMLDLMGKEVFEYKNAELFVGEQPFVSSVSKIYTEMSSAEVSHGKRVVGGCGLRLETKAVEKTQRVSKMWADNWSRLAGALPESWQTCTDGEGSPIGAGFRLLLEDVPAWLNDDYGWMESMLLVSKGENGETIALRNELEAAIQAGDKERFDELIQSNKEAVIATRDRYRRSLVHLAAGAADNHFLEQLLAMGLAADEVDIYGYLPIHYAAMSGAVDPLKRLLKINRQGFGKAQSHMGVTPLMAAIVHGQVDAVKVLIELDSDGRTLVTGYNALHCALHQGNRKIIEQVLSQGWSLEQLNERSEEGGTPFMLACELDDPELVKMLLRKGADPTVKRHDGVTALETAILRDCLPVMEVLIGKGGVDDHAILTGAKQGSAKVVQRLIALPKFYRYRNAAEDTALIVALRAGNFEAVRVIIDHCKSVAYFKTENRQKETAWSLAAGLGSWELIEALHKKGAGGQTEPLLKMDYHPLLQEIIEGEMLSAEQLAGYLSVAVECGNCLAISRVLVPRGAKLSEFKGKNEWTLLHYLAKADGIGLLKRRVLTHGDSPLSPFRDRGEKKTLPFLAAEHGSLRVLRFLLKEIKKRGYSLKTHCGDRHLFYAVLETCDRGLCEWMLEQYEGLASIALDEGKTLPAHVAASRGSVGLLEMLYKANGDLCAVDRVGMTPLDYAMRLGSEETVTYLLKTAKVPLTVECLCLAARTGKRKLLPEDLPVKLLDEALIRAIERYDQTAAEQLIAWGASWGAALGAAAETGQSALLRVLLDGLDLKEYEKEMINALGRATEGGFPGCVALLEKVSKGKGEESETSLDVLLQEKASLDRIEKLPPNKRTAIELVGQKLYGTPLQLMVDLGLTTEKLSAIKALVAIKAFDPNLVNGRGETHAHLLCELDIDVTAIPGVDLEARNGRGESLLHIAASEAGSWVLRKLVKAVGKEGLEWRDHNGMTPLGSAIIAGKDENVKILLEAGADPNACDYQLCSPLSYAVKKERLSLIKALVEAGADLNRRCTSLRVTPLQLSVGLPPEIARTLFAHGASCRAVADDGTHLVHCAAQEGDLQLLRLLHAKGVSLSLRNKDGVAPIHMAASAGKVEVLEEILKYEKEMVDDPLNSVNDKRDRKENPFGQATPLLLGARSTQGTRVVDTLLRHGANVEATTEDNGSVYRFAGMSRAATSILPLLDPYRISQDPLKLSEAMVTAIATDNVDAMAILFERGLPVGIDLGGATPIQVASMQGALQCTQWLLDAGANPWADCREGDNALELAAANRSDEQFRLLLEYTEVPNDWTNSRGRSLLHAAAEAGNIRHVAVLLLSGMSIDGRDWQGRTALHRAARLKRSKMVRFLLACGADPTAENEKGKSPRELVDPEDQKTLAVFDGLHDVVNIPGDTPIHRAIRCRDKLAMMVMSEMHDVNEANDWKETPLHLAATYGLTEVVIHLLRLGADPEVVDGKGRKPIELAGKIETVRVLKASEPKEEKSA